MFLKQLFEAALAHVALGENPTPEAKALHLMVNNQIGLVELAFKELKSVRTDIEALRLEGGNFFQGTGGCEWGHEDCSVTLEWPNLSIMSDTIAELLKTAEGAGQMTPVWYVLYGTEGEFFKALADDREHAMEQCRNAYPGETVHVAVPANEFGGLVMYSYGEEFVTCPKCGRRTEMGELPVKGMQIHVCHRCDHSFIAVPDEDEDTDVLVGDREFAWAGDWRYIHDTDVAVLPCIEETAAGFIPVVAYSYAGDEPDFEQGELKPTFGEARGEAIRKAFAAILGVAAEQPAVTGELAKHQACGCVVCTCEDEVQCQGCGAKHCGTHPVGQIPQPVFNGSATEVTEDLAKRAAEVIADIAFAAGNMHVQGQIQFSDSRELMSDIVKWAYDFEAAFHKDWHGDQYMELVDDYATYRLMDNHAAAEAMLKSMMVGEEVTV